MRLKTTLFALSFIAILTPAGVTRAQAHDDSSDRALTVMTYNMYLGTDFGEILAAQSEQELVAEVAEAFAEVQAGNPPARIAQIADQIAAAGPDMVALQEVALWQTGAFLDTAPASATAYDFLRLLLDELGERGLHYEAVSVLTNFEAEAPAVFGPTLAFDVRFTDRLVVLARTDLQTSRLKVEGVEARHFDTNITLFNPLLGGEPLTILRGWVAVDAKLRGKTYRFVNAHLESFSPLVQFVQANELLQTAGATGMPVVLAGDFNSDAEGGAPTYQLLLSAGFIDAWEATRPNEPGLTWPLFLADPFSHTDPTQRLDLVLSRGEIDAFAADVVGEEDVTPTSPMPSDHAGVVATLNLRP